MCWLLSVYTHTTQVSSQGERFMVVANEMQQYLSAESLIPKNTQTHQIIKQERK